MKFKLSGLLLFSGVASALDITSSNYAQHLCDEKFFVQVPDLTQVVDKNIQQYNEVMIRDDHSQYCRTRFYYEEAVERKRTGTWRTHMVCGGNQKDFIEPARCMEKRGILYAQACEKLKQDRDAAPKAWNAVAPGFVSCNNM